MFQSITFLWTLLAATQGLSTRQSPYVPQVSPESGEPSCARGRTYCVDVEDYPTDIIMKLLKSAPSEITSFLNNGLNNNPDEGSHKPNQEFPQLQTNTSLTKKKDEQLCESHIRIIRPLVARDDNSQWRYIVNVKDKEQLLEIESCLNEERKCNVGYTKQTKAICEQKMVARRLLALDPSGSKLTWHNGMLPSCCQCTLYDGPRVLL